VSYQALLIMRLSFALHVLHLHGQIAVYISVLCIWHNGSYHDSLCVGTTFLTTHVEQHKHTTYHTTHFGESSQVLRAFVMLVASDVHVPSTCCSWHSTCIQLTSKRTCLNCSRSPGLPASRPPGSGTALHNVRTRPKSRAFPQGVVLPELAWDVGKVARF
jgi:hypothetical protein